LAKTIVSVSFFNGFVGDATKNNVASNAAYLKSLGWSNFQFQQETDNGLFGGTQGNDLSGTLLITDAAGVQHRIQGVINWRAPSGAVSTMVFYATGATNEKLATTTGTYTIDPYTEANGDPHSFIGLTFNGKTLTIANDGTVSGNAATSGLLDSLNDYLASQPQLTLADATVTEGAGTAAVMVKLSKASTDTVTVKYTTVDGTAKAGADYTAKTGTLTFAPGETSKQILVPVIDNNTVDGARAVSVVLSDSTFAAITDNTGTVTISDNDTASAPVVPAPVVPAPAATVATVIAEDAAHTGQSPVDSSVVEGAGLVYTVTLSGTGGEHTLAIGGTAGAGDRGAIGFSDGVSWKNGDPATGVVVVPAGVGSFKVTVATVDDSIIESAETLVLTVGGKSANGTVTDNDSQSVTTVLAEDAAHTGAAPVDASVVEGSALLVTVALNTASPAPVEYAVSVGGSAGAADIGSFVFSGGVAWKNGDPASGIVVVPSGVTSFTVRVPTVDDAAVEQTESLTLTVGGVLATGTITDNDSVSVASVIAEDAAATGLSPVDSTVTEGASLRYTVQLNAAGFNPAEFTLVLGGTASSADIGSIGFSDGVVWKNGNPGGGIVVVPAGVGSFKITVATLDDSAIEQAESLTITVGGVAATGTIADNDSQHVSALTDSGVVEGGALLFAATLNGPSPIATEYALALGGSASAADLGLLSFSDGVTWKDNDPVIGIVVVPAGVTSFTVRVPTVDDAAVEQTESLTVTVGGVSATGSIADNDSVSVASVIAEDAAATGLSPADSTVLESGVLRYNVLLNAPGITTTELPLALGGTASPADIDSMIFSDGVTWKNNDPHTGIVVVPSSVGSFKITVTTFDDSAIEQAESLTITVGGVAATGAIADNDSQSVTALTDSGVVEGGALLFAATLNGPSPIATEYALALGGSASAADLGLLSFSDGVTWKNNDPHTGIVVVPAGLSSFKILVATVDDAAVEQTESLTVTVGGVLATGSIADNDSVSVSAVLAEDAANLGAIPLDSAVIEGASLRYTVQLNAAGFNPTELTLALGGSASPADIGSISFSDSVAWKNGDPASGIVVVPAGVDSFKILVSTVDDAAVEQTESLTITVGGVQGAGIITDNDSVSVASVIAEDAAAAGLSPVDSTVTEGGILRYSVLLNTATIDATEFVLALGGSAEAADLNGMIFSDGVAWKDNDPATGIVVAPGGVDSFKITVATLDDSAIEQAESLTISVGGVASTGTIVDNDSQSVTALVAENAAHRGATPVDSNVVEGGILLFAATLNGPSPAATEYALTLGGSASAADLGLLSFSDGVAWKDNDPHTGIVVVPAGLSAFTATLLTADDAVVESTETVSMTIGGVLATGTIADNDSLNVSAVTAEDAANAGQNPIDSTVTEGGTLQYAVTLNAAAVAPTAFSLVLGGTASDADLGALVFSDGVSWQNRDPHSGIVVVPAGVSHFTVTLPTIDDAIVEASESAVLSVNGVHATGTIVDNDQPAVAPVAPAPAPVPVPAPAPEPAPAPVPEPAPAPVPAPAPAPAPVPALQGGLNPASDDGASSTDAVTSVRTPEFTISGGALLSAGGSLRLLSPSGELVSSSVVSAADVAAGKIDLSPGALDDGVYTYTVQVLDAAGQVTGTTPVSVTVVTDLDGVLPSVELAAYGGDYNKDGVLDWQQNAVALLPLGSLADFAKGVNAPVSSFGAVIAGSLGTELDTVHLTSGAQLRGLSLSDLPKPLESDYRAASPVFNFTVTATEEAKVLPDLDPNRAGLQTRVVIELGQTGVASNDFLKFDKTTGTWFSYLDDQNLATFDDGATLVDLNGDGRIDRIVITLTDGGRGDEDGVVNGVIVDPGLLSFNKALDQVYSVRMAGGELYYTADAKDAQTHAAGTGNVFQGVVFDSMSGQAGTQHVEAWYQPFTQDTTYAASANALPYACYELVAGAAGFDALGSASGIGVGIHLYQDKAGHTELMTAAQAQQQGLLAKGYTDRGIKFNATMENAFNFDAEGYLVANHDNASVQALVQQLAASYQSTSAAGFIEAVEQNYFQQIQLVGVAHGAAATAADLNTVFGTHFGN
jgi:hypothetical protein